MKPKRRGTFMAYTADRNLYVNRDRTKVVEEGSEDAAFLLAAEGQTVPDAEAKKLGLGENKQIVGAENKAPVQPSSATPAANTTQGTPAPAPKDNTMTSAKAGLKT